MAFNNPSIIEVSDLNELYTLSLSEEQGVPVVHLAFSLKGDRQYSADPTAFFLPLPSEPRMYYPLHTADTTPLEDTAKREAVPPQEPAQPTIADVETLLEKVVESEQAVAPVPDTGEAAQEGASEPDAKDKGAK